MTTGLILIFFSIASYILSIYFYIKQPYNSFYSFTLWVLSILLLLLYLIYKEGAKINLAFNLKSLSFVKFLNINKLLIAIVVLAIIVRFWNITSIPILTHDEAKDAGLFPQKIISGELKDYFGFNAGINHIFFVLSSIPHIFLTDPILKVRFFSALFGVFSVLLIFLLAKKMYGNKLGLVAAVLLSVYHVHVHFSRTEFLNLFDSFYTLIILIAFFILNKSWKINNTIFLAVVLGVGLHFYSGLRAFIAITSITFLIFTFIKYGLKKSIGFIIVFSIFFLIALGPTSVVMTTRKDEAMALGTATSIFSESQNFSSTLNKLGINYTNSLLVYVKTPIDFHYNYGGPFLVFPFSIFFIFGILLILKKINNPINFLIVSSVIGIPFLNSAIFTNINFTHRLLSLIPLIILVTSLGLEKSASLIKKITNTKAEISFLVIMCAYFITYNLHLYFYKNVWEKALNINEFRAWEMQKIINQEDNKSTAVLFIGTNYYPSYKSVPPLEYLTKKYNIIDIVNPEMLHQFINYRNFVNYLFILLPDNNIVPNEQILSRYFYTKKPYFERVYYKNMYLFDLLRMTKSI
mgnify:CR=1 FL=1